jgi:membrane-associated phospholipid phosphatase
MPALYTFDSFLLIQSALASPWLDLPMALLTTACEGWSLTIIGIALVWVLERRLARTFRAAVPVLLSLLGSGLVVQLVKRLVQLPRPLSVLGPARVHLVLEPLGQLSFPSGHAAAVAALAMALTIRYGRQVWWVWMLAFLGGLSRVYVGAHWATDVAAGWLVGLACGLAVASLLRARAAQGPRPSQAPRLTAARAVHSATEAA